MGPCIHFWTHMCAVLATCNEQLLYGSMYSFLDAYTRKFGDFATKSCTGPWIPFWTHICALRRAVYIHLRSE